MIYSVTCEVELRNNTSEGGMVKLSTDSSEITIELPKNSRGNVRVSTKDLLQAVKSLEGLQYSL